MVDRIVCPVLVRRDEELAVLEDGLLAAHRGESRFVLVAGEAGIGKTRLTTELATSARKLGCAVLWGGCSEAELSLPYLPFVEAIGNHLATEDVGALAERLGPARRELAQLFPQLADDAPAELQQDPAQAKLRLFEAVVSLLDTVSSDRTLLFVVDDVHWADTSTRELLDHLARRLTALRMLLVVTYRSDELHRRHPLAPAVQAWRRSGLVETVKLGPLPPAGVAEMIRVMFDAPNVEDDFRNLMYERSEGNPFVLEEMLKEAIERGDIFRTAGGWERKSLSDLEIPETVRDTILLRFERFDPDHAAILQSAAVLGRIFDDATLVAVAQADEDAVYSALEAAIGQQLIEEHANGTGAWRWRHALTQEAIYTDMVTPRRQQFHSRAADVLASRPGTRSVDLAHHLLGAARFSEAVPACLRSAEEAEHAVAFGEAVSLLERALPHVADPLERARVVCAIGRLCWFNGEPVRASQFLAEGIAELESLGQAVEAARFRVILGRCHWEQLRSDLALRDYEAARDVLEIEGPSADLATAYLRIAGQHVFEFEYDACFAAAERAIEVAEAAGADFERVWAHAFLGLGLMGRDVPGGFAVTETAYEEAVSKQYWLIAANIGYNDIWCRVQLMQPGLEERLARVEGLPIVPAAVWSSRLTRGYVKQMTGDLHDALDGARSALAAFEMLRQGKMIWRANVLLAEVLAEAGRVNEAAAALPDVSERSDLQDIVYDSAAQIRVRLRSGQVAEASVLAEEVLRHAGRLARYRSTLAVAIEAFIAAGRSDDARALLAHGRAEPVSAGVALLDEAEGRVLLAEGDPVAAMPLLRSAVTEAHRLGFRLVEWRAGLALADALGRTDALEEAAERLRTIVAAAETGGAKRIADAGRSLAASLEVELPERQAADTMVDLTGEALALGERLVTSLFADVRGYTAFTTTAGPEELTERMTALYRFARTEVERHYGIVDKFAGDAVMATFNVAGTRLDHAVQALEAALALRDKAALLDLRLGIGIAVGPAVLGQGASDANIAVRGVATNLAARLQAVAEGGEILLSGEAYRRVEGWLANRGVTAQREELTLKGFDEVQVGFRIAPPAALRA